MTANKKALSQGFFISADPIRLTLGHPLAIAFFSLARWTMIAMTMMMPMMASTQKQT
jgi:hypothetical protein